MKPFLRFVGTILRNQIAEIPGQPRFCVKRVLFFVFFDFPEERERISETGKKFEKFLQSQRAGLLKRAMKALTRVGLGPSRQACFGKRRLKMKENRRLWLD